MEGDEGGGLVLGKETNLGNFHRVWGDGSGVIIENTHVEATWVDC